MRSCTLQKGLKTWKSCDVAGDEVFVVVSLCTFAEAAGMVCGMVCALFSACGLPRC